MPDDHADDAGPHQTRFEVEEGVARLTLVRPERRNAMTFEMIREVYSHLVHARQRTDIRVLVLTGSGDSFSPGGDVAHFLGDAERRPLEPEYFHTATLLHDIAAVTVAAIDGPCAGAGLGWALACDLRVASSRSRFNTAFLDVAVPGDMGVPWTLQRVVGAGRARELSFLPGKFDAAHAAEIGLVSRVAEPGDYDAEVEGVVARLAAADPVALRGIKANHLAAETTTFRDYITSETERIPSLSTWSLPEHAIP